MAHTFTGKFPIELLERQWSAKLEQRFISTSNPFQLTVTTLEKQFHFQLKQAITESTYNQLWLEIEKKNGRIQ